MLIRKILTAAIITFTSTSMAADIKSANEYQNIMQALGARVSVDPSYSGSLARYTYRVNG